ncbi:MAG: AmmeMemoRadiSam system protein A [Firmicutes bacterium]|nr:AmmeMemoRadiSam system protein A [Bacillota bacterium]
MSILAAYMVPHPPMIVPAIGRGSEAQIPATIQAYQEIARDVARLRPDTLIITSPHQIMYRDYFHISPGSRASGSFSQFRAPQVTFQESYDTALVQEISRLADEAGLPAGTMGERDKQLDHGTMVPLWFIRNVYPDGRIVRIGLSGLPLADHYRLGMLIQQAVNALGRRAVFIASGDLSHKLQSYGPYGFAPEGPAYDERIMDVMGRGAFGELFDFSEDFCNKAAECGHRSFVIMAGALDGRGVRAEALSHEDVTGVGYGICRFIPEAEDQDRRFLSILNEKELAEICEKSARSDAYVRLARQAVEAYVSRKERLAVPKNLPSDILEEKAGAFVSIHEHGLLRGCIGTILPCETNLAEEIISNAISACSRDPRFNQILPDELPYLDITVDVLGKPEDITSPDQLDVKRYGVIVTYGRKRGLLLPDLEGVDTVSDQISIARQKGGIREDDPYSLQRFEVIRHY